MKEYSQPSIMDLGSLSELTLSDINKTSGSGDTIHIAGLPPISVPGGGVTSVS